MKTREEVIAMAEQWETTAAMLRSVNAPRDGIETAELAASELRRVAG